MHLPYLTLPARELELLAKSEQATEINHIMVMIRTLFERIELTVTKDAL